MTTETVDRETGDITSGKRESFTLAGVVTALAPISHQGSQRGGTIATLNREPFVQPDGTVEDVPIITGNSFRGQLRDVGMRAMCEVLDIKLDLPEFHLLFSGGMLSKADAGSGINVRSEDYRRLRDLVPWLSMLGGAVAGQIPHGKVDMGRFVPICRETVHLLPDRATDGMKTIPSMADYQHVYEFTRTDDIKGGRYRHLLSQSALRLIGDPDPEEGTPLLSDGEQPTTPPKRGRGKKATAEGDDRDDGPATQMRYGTEAFVAGTRFWHQMHIHLVTNLEREALWSALAAWAQRSTLGGKSAIGFGRVRIDYEQVTLQSSITGDSQAVAFAVGSEYLAHLHRHREEISEILHRMAA